MLKSLNVRTPASLLAGIFGVCFGALAQMAPAQTSPQKDAQPGPAHIINREPAGVDVTPSQPRNTATDPVARTGEKDKWWMERHESFNARVKQGAAKGDIGMLFIGDSITQGWEGAGKDVWAEFYAKRNAVNLGIGGDRIQHVLWRLEHGNLDGLASPAQGSTPKVAVVMIGTNNSNGTDNSAEEIASGVRAIVGDLRAKLPQTKVILLGIFPRGEKPNAQRDKIASVNASIAALNDGKTVFYMDIGGKFLGEGGTLSKEIMPDFLHLSPAGYKLWAEAIEAKVKELMGES